MKSRCNILTAQERGWVAGLDFMVARGRNPVASAPSNPYIDEELSNEWQGSFDRAIKDWYAKNTVSSEVNKNN